MNGVHALVAAVIHRVLPGPSTGTGVLKEQCRPVAIIVNKAPLSWSGNGESKRSEDPRGAKAVVSCIDKKIWI